MSVKILTIEEAEKTKKLCEQYGEVCEIVTGKAKLEYMCDNSGEQIPKGTECAVVLVLPSRNHHNYEAQLASLGDYVHQNHDNESNKKTD